MTFLCYHYIFSLCLETSALKHAWLRHLACCVGVLQAIVTSQEYLTSLY